MITSGIYCIRNKLNGKVYIGSSVNISKRQGQHLQRLRTGKHHNHKLQSSWNKHGEEAFEFEVLFECKPEYLLFMENTFIGGHNAVVGGYNIAPKAGHTLGYKHTPETKAFLSNKKKGTTVSEELKKRLSDSCKASWSDELKERQRVIRTGRKHSEETKAKIGASKVGKPRSDELKAKLSAAKTGKKLSEAHRAAIAEAGRRRYAKLRGEI